MERPLGNILQNEQVGAKTPNFGCFFISSTEWVAKTDFGQVITTLSNETENPLWYNYTVKGQNWIS